MAHGQGGAEISFDRGPTLTCNHEAPILAHALRGEGFDASEDGTGRGTPLVPVLSNDPATAICANEQRTYTNEGSVFQLRNVVGQPVGVTLHGTDGTQSVASYTDLSSSLRARIPSGVENSTTTAVMQPITFRADAMREGTAKTPSPDAEGRVRLRDPGIGMYEDIAPTLDCGAAHGVAQPVTYDLFNVTAPINRQNRQPGDPCHTLARANAEHAVVLDPIPIDTMNHLGRGDSHSFGDFQPGAPSYTLTKGHSHAVAVAVRTANTSANGHGISAELAHTLDRAQGQAVLAPTLTATNDPSRSPQSSEITAQVAAVVQATAIAFSSKDHGADATADLAPTLRAMNHADSHANGGGQMAVAAWTTKLHNTASNQSGKVYEEYATSLDRSSPPPALLTPMQVRRLTPRECERLQGFPDDYTAIPWRGKPASDCPDGPRYKALGNSWAVPCVRWIGRRIAAQIA